MSMKRFSSLLLAIAVALSASASSLRADSTSVQWGDEISDVSASSGLQWKKPKTASSIPKTAAQPIQQVQFQQPIPAPPQPPVAPPMPPMGPPAGTNPTPKLSELDYLFPEKRPQSVTPPAGATSQPNVPGSSPSAFSMPTPTVEPKATQPTKTETPSSTSKIQMPTTGLDSPVKSGSTPAPQPTSKPELDPVTTLPLPSLKGSKEITCPDNAGFKSIREISYDIRPMPGELPKECPLRAQPFNGRYFGRTCYLWQASALATKGAYFEDVQLERYGHTVCCPALQPIISGVRFFVTVPLLPYKMGLTPPNECVYTLGHYRVGNCAPHMLDPLPISVRAVLFEAAAVGGAVAIIP